jgi:hypothetical protein
LPWGWCRGGRRCAVTEGRGNKQRVSLDYDWQWGHLRAPHWPPRSPRASRTPRPPRTASGAPQPPRASPSLLLILRERVEGRVRPNKLRLLQGFANSRIRPANPTQDPPFLQCQAGRPFTGTLPSQPPPDQQTSPHLQLLQGLVQVQKK